MHSYTRTIQCRAEGGPLLFKLAIHTPLQDDSGLQVQSGKVALERHIAWGHCDAGAHALKGPSTSIVPAQVVKCMLHTVPRKQDIPDLYYSIPKSASPRVIQ